MISAWKERLRSIFCRMYIPQFFRIWNRQVHIVFRIADRRFSCPLLPRVACPVISVRFNIPQIISCTRRRSFFFAVPWHEVGGPLRDAVELLPAEGAVHAGFGFGAEAAGGREFAQPPALIEFSPALRRLFHTENPLDFQYSAVSGTINRRYGLFCKNLAF